ncbi:hypothetical protein EDD18DRAFT_1335284 [Armillaria luteobubalina]|uniref:HMG box domain-containing protein n=1 Tax=Armillaria luteobubalina TaxID=153913 RepID=A0AA39PPH6_9AGAR|nr:hypothetical protein EDD18DRAFT_1335284 [Armillaria luteobubalina]
MAHAPQLPYTLLSDLALVHNDLSTLPAAQTSNASMSAPKTPSRRPRTPFIIFRDVFLAANKNTLPRRQIEVNAIAGPIWQGLSEEGQAVYKMLARLEKDSYERDSPAHAVQYCGSGGGKGSKSDRGRRKIPSRSAADQPGTEAQALPCHSLAIAPAVEPLVPCGPSMTNTGEMLDDVHATHGRGIVDAQHRYAAQNMQFLYELPASTSVAATFVENSDPQIHNHAAYYHNALGQNFTLMNPAAILQYLPSAPTVTPITHGPELFTATFQHQLDTNADVRNVSRSSPASFMEVGSSTGERESSLYYERPAQSTWEVLQCRQRPLWSDYSERPT